MLDTIRKSVAEWDALETSKRDHLKELNSKKALAEARRADLLLLIGEKPNDKERKKELEDLERTRRELALEIESVEALLKAIPERRNFARAREIEVEINDLLRFDERLKESCPSIDAAAEAFAARVGEYVAILNELHQLDSRTFHPEGVDALAKNSLGAAFLKNGLKGWVNIGDFRNPQSMTDNLKRNPTRNQIDGRIVQIRELAARLRGENGNGLEICMDCGGAIVWEYGGERRCCRTCGSAGARLSTSQKPG